MTAFAGGEALSHLWIKAAKKVSKAISPEHTFQKEFNTKHLSTTGTPPFRLHPFTHGAHILPGATRQRTACPLGVSVAGLVLLLLLARAPFGVLRPALKLSSSFVPTSKASNLPLMLRYFRTPWSVMEPSRP